MEGDAPALCKGAGEFDVNTHAQAVESEPPTLRQKVEASLARIRPALLADGGDVELVEVRDGTAVVKFLGACRGCPLATDTLKDGIEVWVRMDVPGIAAVEAVTVLA